MSQQNYISNSSIPLLNLNKKFNFAGFLFYVDGWDWSNLQSNTNYDQDGVSDFIRDLKLSFPNNPLDVIDYIVDEYEGLSRISNSDAFKKIRLYLLAATCRKYQIYSPWNSTCQTRSIPDFLQTYSIDTPNRTPSTDGFTSWSMSSGDIQAYTNEDSGNLRLGSYVFAKNLDAQAFTPVSIDNSTRNFYTEPGGFGENISSNTVSNYYNINNVFVNDLLPLKDGWYGIVTENSVPYGIYGGIGINFDTFFKLEGGVLIEFHHKYPQSDYIDNISEYGKNSKSYMVEEPWDYNSYTK